MLLVVRGCAIVTKIKTCKDCTAEGRTGKPLAAPHPGPRCHRHNQAKKRAGKARAAETRHVNIYGLQPGQYEAILEAQGGGCGFCYRPPRAGGRRLAVDHDHSCCPGKSSCGKCVRGLLCWTCNKFSEHIADSQLVVAKMVDYYRDPPAQRGFIKAVS